MASNCEQMTAILPLDERWNVSREEINTFLKTMRNELCEDCLRSVPAGTPKENFFSVGWGCEFPDSETCPLVYTLVGNDSMYMAVNTTPGINDLGVCPPIVGTGLGWSRIVAPNGFTFCAGDICYVPDVDSDWINPNPVNGQQALDRLAGAVIQRVTFRKNIPVSSSGASYSGTIRPFQITDLYWDQVGGAFLFANFDFSLPAGKWYFDATIALTLSTGNQITAALTDATYAPVNLAYSNDQSAPSPYAPSSQRLMFLNHALTITERRTFRITLYFTGSMVESNSYSQIRSVFHLNAERKHLWY